jgi:hypothetical protein
MTARKVALRINGMQVTKATLRRREKKLEVVIADSLIGEFVIDESFTVELLDLVHQHETRSGLPNGGWRKVPLRIFIALLRGEIVRVVGQS